MKKILALVFVSISPIITLAQPLPSQGVGGLFSLSSAFLTKAVFFIISLAVVWFIFNVFRYTISGDDAKKKEAKDGMVWGIVGIFVMVSVWGLVAILQATFQTSGFSSSNVANGLKDMFPKF